jgi:hemin uptake protein HemP
MRKIGFITEPRPTEPMNQRRTAPQGRRPHAPRAPAAPSGPLRLLRGGKMVEIRHNGEVYRLQATRLGKLILTK